MNIIKSFLQLTWLQKILFGIAFTMLLINFYHIAQWPIFEGKIINPEQPNFSVSVYHHDAEIEKVDTTYKLQINPQFYNTSSFESVSLNYSYGKPYLNINYKGANEYLFSKLWWWNILGQIRYFSETVIFIFLLLIVLEVKKDKTFNRKTIRYLFSIAILLIMHPIIYIINNYILESFLSDNFYGRFNHFGAYSKASYFFYPLFLSLVVLVLIDLFRKGNTIETENDLTI
jgi:hypothetical protein